MSISPIPPFTSSPPPQFLNLSSFTSSQLPPLFSTPLPHQLNLSTLSILSSHKPPAPLFSLSLLSHPSPLTPQSPLPPHTSQKKTPLLTLSNLTSHTSQKNPSKKYITLYFFFFFFFLQKGACRVYLTKNEAQKRNFFLLM